MPRPRGASSCGCTRPRVGLELSRATPSPRDPSRPGVDALVEFYGSTEGQFTRCSASESLAHPGTVGLGAGRTNTLRNDASDGRLLRCRAPHFARFEYWNDPEKTSDAWDGDWFSVGDLGRVDAEGYVYLEGRRSDLIITGGVNVYPAEIELALSQLSRS